MKAASIAAALVLGSSATAIAAPAAGPLQRLEIDRSAAKTHPCGYNAGSRGGASKLSQFRIVTLDYEGKEVAQVAAVRWNPDPAYADACELVFVRKPGYTLRSLLTSAHPFVEWAPISWGSEPFFPPQGLNKLWRQWFNVPPPNWLSVAKDIYP